jgi:hypothetical protein
MANYSNPGIVRWPKSVDDADPALARELIDAGGQLRALQAVVRERTKQQLAAACEYVMFHHPESTETVLVVAQMMERTGLIKKAAQRILEQERYFSGELTGHARRLLMDSTPQDGRKRNGNGKRNGN